MLNILGILNTVFNILTLVIPLFKRKELPMVLQEPGTSEPKKPATTWNRSPNFSSRNGQQITHIVLHYTTSRNAHGTLEWFSNPVSRVSAHYVIDREGRIFQCVSDSDKAWHAKKANGYTIGIEHCAAKGDPLTVPQEAASVALIAWLLAEYKIPPDHIVGHGGFAGNQTDCPGDIFGGDLRGWVGARFKELPGISSGT